MRGKPRTYGKRCQCAVQSQAGATSSAPAFRAPAATPTWPVRRSGCHPRGNKSVVGTGLAPYGASPVKPRAFPARHRAGQAPHLRKALPMRRSITGRGYVLRARVQGASGHPDLAGSPERDPSTKEQICRRYGACPYGAFPAKPRVFPARHRAGQAPHLRSIAPMRRSITGRGYVLRARIQGASGDPDLVDSPGRVPPVREQICRRYGACPVRRFPGEASCIPGKASCGASPAPMQAPCLAWNVPGKTPGPAIAALLRTRPAPGAGTAR